MRPMTVVPPCSDRLRKVRRFRTTAACRAIARGRAGGGRRAVRGGAYGGRPCRRRPPMRRSQMLDLQDRLDELMELALYRRMRMVSGPQGPRVLLDGRPVLLLCSDNCLGLADHPRVRQAAADAALRWGAGAGSARLVSGNMTLHRRLEERLAAFLGTPTALLFGSAYLAAVGVIPALARPGEIVFADERNAPALLDGCRLSGAEVVTYRHADVDHLHWALRDADGRAALIVTSTVFPVDGDVAPLPELVALARLHDVRVLADEAHGLGALGPGGRGAVADAGLDGEVDVVCGTLGTALGGYGGYVGCDGTMARHLLNAARPMAASTALPPTAAAAGLAALEVLEAQPRRVDRLADNADALRTELAREGLELPAAETHIVTLAVEDARRGGRVVGAPLDEGVYVDAVCPPLVPDGEARIRLTVMATHTRAELREA